METPIGDDEDSHLGDFIEDVIIESPVDSASSEGLSEATREILASLTPREAKVLPHALRDRHEHGPYPRRGGQAV